MRNSFVLQKTSSMYPHANRAQEHVHLQAPYITTQLIHLPSLPFTIASLPHTQTHSHMHTHLCVNVTHKNTKTCTQSLTNKHKDHTEPIPVKQSKQQFNLINELGSFIFMSTILTCHTVFTLKESVSAVFVPVHTERKVITS